MVRSIGPLDGLTGGGGLAIGRLGGSITVAAVLLVAGCGLSDRGVAAGPCALQVHTTTSESIDQVLHPPYEVVLRPPSLLDTVGPTDISFSGHGWTQTRVTVTNPGLRDEMDIVSGEDINGGFRGWVVDAPGTWRIRLEAGPCLREFIVRATP